MDKEFEELRSRGIEVRGSYRDNPTAAQLYYKGELVGTWSLHQGAQWQQWVVPLGEREEVLVLELCAARVLNQLQRMRHKEGQPHQDAGKEQPHQYTIDEVKSHFLEHVAGCALYWERQPTIGDTGQTNVSGAVFHTLSVLDGGALSLPGFLVTPRPHEEDEEYLRGEGMNWFPSEGDIGGALHELFYNHYNKLKRGMSNGHH